MSDARCPPESAAPGASRMGNGGEPGKQEMVRSFNAVLVQLCQLLVPILGANTTTAVLRSALLQRFISCGLFDSPAEYSLLERIGTQLLARIWHIV